MSSPAEILNERYGAVFLSKLKNLKISSGADGVGRERTVAVYASLLETGSVTPVVLTALVDGNGPESGATLAELQWSSVHVRSYNSWADLVSAGLDLADTEARKPTVGALKGKKDIKMVAVAETANSKVYQFEVANAGKLTVFTAAPVIAAGGNDLPRKTTFLPWLNENNFVYERA